MPNLPKLSVLGLMLLMHFLADYTLQGWLANGKQKKWWDDATKGMDNRDMYRNDWIAGMVCHSLYWSLLVCIPLFPRLIYLPMAIVQAAAHFWIDDMKANRLKINLIEDQFLHLAQIVGVWLFSYCWGTP